MNHELVESITLSDDSILDKRESDFRRNAKDLQTGAAKEDEVRYVVKYIKEASDAFKSDFYMPKGPTFRVHAKDQILNMVFDESSAPHLYGFSANTYRNASLYEYMTTRHPNIKSQLGSRCLNELEKLSVLLNPVYMEEIIAHECSEENSPKYKLNWQKMMLKIFDMINLGLLEDGSSILYKEVRNKYSIGKPSYLLVRSLRNGELEDASKKNERYYDRQLFLKLVEENINGYVYLVPQSIYLVKKDLDLNGQREKIRNIKLSDYGIGESTSYNYYAHAYIERIKGNEYER